MMNKTLAMMQLLDAQLTVLNIEGIRSEHQIYEYEETETDEIPCEHCEGEGVVYFDDLDRLEWDDYLEDLIPIEYEDCPHCKATGCLIKSKVVKYRESWTESNIFI